MSVEKLYEGAADMADHLANGGELALVVDRLNDLPPACAALTTGLIYGFLTERYGDAYAERFTALLIDAAERELEGPGPCEDETK